MAPKTHSPDPTHIADGAGTAASQAAQPRMYASPTGIGWTDTAPVAATGATAGTPGTFTPAGGHVANLAGMAGVTATPALAWTTGQRVVLDDGSEAHWTGTAWAAGQGTAVATRAAAPSVAPART